MTDREIIKALECCSKLDYDRDWIICKTECPYKRNCFVEEKGINALKDWLDLINRQQAEIKRLKYLLEYEEAKYDKCAKHFYKAGVKEFAERLKEIMCQENEIYISCAKNMLSKDFQRGYEEKNDDVIKHIDTLLEEMEREGK